MSAPTGTSLLADEPPGPVSEHDAGVAAADGTGRVRSSDALAVVALMSASSAFVSVVGRLAAAERSVPIPDSLHTQIGRVFMSWGGLLLVTGLVLAYRRTTRDDRRRDRALLVGHMVSAVILVLPVIWTPVRVVVQNIPQALACIPPTGFALWTVHRMQRHRRMPFRVIGAGFLWGALIATGFSGDPERWYSTVAPGILGEWPAQTSGQALCAGIVEELCKGAGVAVVFILGRHWVDDIVSGIVVGAAVGLGFNFTESIAYIAGSGEGASFQHWARQTVGLMGGHLAFSALVGAAFGVAVQVRNGRWRRAVIVCGFLLAISAHFTNNFFLVYLRVQFLDWTVGPTVRAMVLLPLQLLVVQGPFVVMYLILLRRGLRHQASALEVELRAEAESGSGAITTAEERLLVTPALRFLERVDALRRGGTAAYRTTTRLRAAQLDLAMLRWHRTRDEAARGRTAEDGLRDDIVTLKAVLEAAT